MAVILALVKYHDAIFEDQKNNNNNNNNHYNCSLGILMQRKKISKVREKNSQFYLTISLNRCRIKVEGKIYHYENITMKIKNFVLP